MAVYGQPDVFLYADGYDFGQRVTQISGPKGTAKTEQTDGFGDGWVEHSFVGVKEWSLSFSGFHDDASSGPHAAIGQTSDIGSTAIICFGVETTATGAEFLGGTPLEVDYERSAERGALVKFSLTAMGNGKLDQGLIVHPLTGRSASGNTTAAAIDFGVSATGGAAVYLQVMSFASGAGATGASGIMIQPLHSADNLTFSTYGSSFGVSAAPQAQRLVSTAPIQRYRALKWEGASAAGGPSTCTFFLGIANTTA
jgi:hypothetical protein